MNETELQEMVRKRLSSEAVAGMPDGTAAPMRAIHDRVERLHRARRRRYAATAGAVAAVAAVVGGASLLGGGHLGSTPPPSHRPSTGTIRHHGVDCTRLVASAQSTGPSTDLFTFDAACTPVLLATATGDDNEPTLSADGRLVVFVHRADARAHLPVSLMLLDRSSGAITRLARSAFGLGSPAFSPDGTRVAFWSEGKARRPHLLVTSIRAGGVTQLTSDNGTDLAPAWSPNGTRLAYATGSGLVTVNASSGAVNALPRQPARISRVFWSYPGMGPGLFAIQEMGVNGDSFRIVALDQRTGAPQGGSRPIKGQVSGAVSDTFGVHVAYTSDGSTTTVAAYDGQWGTIGSIIVQGAGVSFAAVPPIPPLGHTPDGRTYGSESGGRHPDLVAAVGAAGDGSQVTGYAASRDLDGRSPANPEQAVRWNDIGPSSVLLYAEDGVTIVGLFPGGGAMGTALTTYVATPPGATPTTATGTISQDGGCVYLDHDNQRTWLVLPWGVHDSSKEDGLVDADGQPVTGFAATTPVTGHVVPGQTSAARCGGAAPTYVTALDGHDLTTVGRP